MRSTYPPRGKNFDLTGQRFGMLVVLERGRKEIKSGTKLGWMVRCDCGNVLFRYSSDLKGNKTVSCGCMRREMYTRRKFDDNQPLPYGAKVNAIDLMPKPSTEVEELFYLVEPRFEEEAR